MAWAADAEYHSQREAHQQERERDIERRQLFESRSVFGEEVWTRGDFGRLAASEHRALLDEAYKIAEEMTS
ncbi:MAG: hypothetical protein CL484_10060 [Acidobacteria bacterium]|nr:hypothetical protein [Acidobacteriota bacterium]